MIRWWIVRCSGGRWRWSRHQGLRLCRIWSRVWIQRPFGVELEMNVMSDNCTIYHSAPKGTHDMLYAHILCAHTSSYTKTHLAIMNFCILLFHTTPTIITIHCIFRFIQKHSTKLLLQSTIFRRSQFIFTRT